EEESHVIDGRSDFHHRLLLSTLFQTSQSLDEVVFNFSSLNFKKDFHGTSCSWHPVKKTITRKEYKELKINTPSDKIHEAKKAILDYCKELSEIELLGYKLERSSLNPS